MTHTLYATNGTANTATNNGGIDSALLAQAIMSLGSLPSYANSWPTPTPQIELTDVWSLDPLPPPPERICPKCDTREMSVRYCAMLTPHNIFRINAEHMHLVCSKCSFEKATRTLDEKTLVVGKLAGER